MPRDNAESAHEAELDFGRSTQNDCLIGARELDSLV